MVIAVHSHREYGSTVVGESARSREATSEASREDGKSSAGRK
jgi:hypothetical protein